MHSIKLMLTKTIVPLSANVYTKTIGCVCAHAFVLYVSNQVM